MTAFFDTNVLVYAFDQADVRKQERAIDLIENGPRFVISAQVLSEFYVTVTRKLATPLSETDAAHAVQQFAQFTVVPTDTPLITAAVAASRAHRLSYWDALILEAAASSGCDELYSEDLADGSTLRGVRIHNPFA